jgi:NAD(P)-dependent dehydrogenase (short-subunit alcohol dehydrogenase family)
MGRFLGQTVIVTGASAGIGAALCRRFAEEGADVALLARRKEALDKAASAVQALGRRAIPIECDVTRDEDVERAADVARRELGRIDVVVANAGIGINGAFAKLQIDDFRRQFETNVFGVLRTVRATLGDVEQTKGRIAIVGSVAPFVIAPGTVNYAMSKAAVGALAQGLEVELAPKGVSVTLILPGFVESEIRLIDNSGRFREDFKDPAPKFIVMPTEEAAKDIVDGIWRRQPECIITGHGKLGVMLGRHTPRLVASVLRVAHRLAPLKFIQ